MTAIRVLVVDDSVVVRRLVTDALAADPRVEVVGTASDGRRALARVEQLKPDVVTMDVEMPDMNGIEAVRALRTSGSRVPIIMFSTLTERGAAATLDALVAGASDYVTKPSNMGSVQESIARVAEELIPKILVLAGGPGAAGRGHLGARPAAGGPGGAGLRTPGGYAPTAAPGGQALGGFASRAAGFGLARTAPAGGVPARAASPAPPAPHPVRMVVVGSSTGGPQALSTLVTALTAPPRVPVVVVQHMPPVFTHQLAARLDRLGPARVSEAVDGEELRPGHVYIAPGGEHLLVRNVRGTLRAVLDQGPPVNFCKPSVDVMFDSAVEAVGGDLVCAVLTGMGSDGRNGAGKIVAAGGTVLAQDEATSVVWGMPGAVTTSGFAHRVLPLDDVPGAIEAAVAAAVGAPQPAAHLTGGVR
ncbi:MAG: chemotaxis response regulator protein-glutamate methylesterase [Cellulomonas sp. 73-145]|uniref:chemotaxis-specific protein-glutamate methyltransferase CheB n=1 Tax=Cellulomonas sp. 73-145 TaxID=1895739 RepID=UPI00092C0F1B|nr:chemotaxis-specific protein-glutamate methyltransferase CheB [Cellulomonas sp. 73-145]MBN9326009.1 chemotaxis-specific protein-glutamate methyltransferase CheB [Cellulomonas sp.]OJV57344.1 MAG: chemotaxis response regulator protein-glutamate methylesterase [Cellulomonas sp. 73-145]